MAESVNGHCLCGNVTYKYSGTIGPVIYCHCEDCRRLTGSAFNVGVRFDVIDFHLTGEQPCSFTKQADSGNDITRHFCARCGSPVYTSSPLHPEHIYVKAGTIDDQSVIRPSCHIWSDSAVPWCSISDDLPRYKKGTGSDTL